MYWCVSVENSSCYFYWPNSHLKFYCRGEQPLISTECSATVISSDVALLLKWYRFYYYRKILFQIIELFKTRLRNSGTVIAGGHANSRGLLLNHRCSNWVITLRAFLIALHVPCPTSYLALGWTEWNKLFGRTGLYKFELLTGWLGSCLASSVRRNTFHTTPC